MCIRDSEDSGNSLLTVSFSYFSSILGLFSDKVYTDFYETLALKLCRLDDVLSSAHALGEVSACILFYMEPNSFVDENFDEAHAIHSAFGRHSQELMGFCSMEQLRGTMDTLRSLSHLYSAHANKHNTPKSPAAASSSSNNSSSSTTTTTNNNNNWLKSQLSLLTGCCQDVCIGSDDLIQLGLALAVEDKTAFARDVVVNVLKKRIDLIVAANNASAEYSNLSCALQFVLRILESCDSGSEQLGFLLGHGDKEIWNEWFRDCKEDLFKKIVLFDDAENVLSDELRDLFLSSRDLVTLMILLCLYPYQEKYLSLLATTLKESLGDLSGEKMFQKMLVLLQNVRSL